MDGALSIIKLFCKDLERELTMRQISKLIKKSYAYTNKEAWDLINKGVLNKKEIGKSIVCSLNITNELTRSLLTLNSALEKQAFYKGDKDGIIKQAKENDAYTVFISKKKIYIVCKDRSNFKHIKAHILTKQDFLSIGLDNLILYGFEKYWEIIGDNYA